MKRRDDHIPSRDRKSDANGADFARLAERCKTILLYLGVERPYLRPDFSLWELSRAVAMPVSVVSAAINRCLGKNYLELVNAYRLEEAHALLRDAAGRGLRVNIADVAARSGFTSRSVFYKRFVAAEGITPRQYLERHYQTNAEQISNHNNTEPL